MVKLYIYVCTEGSMRFSSSRVIPRLLCASVARKSKLEQPSRAAAEAKAKALQTIVSSIRLYCCHVAACCRRIYKAFHILAALPDLYTMMTDMLISPFQSCVCIYIPHWSWPLLIPHHLKRTPSRVICTWVRIQMVWSVTLHSDIAANAFRLMTVNSKGRNYGRQEAIYALMNSFTSCTAKYELIINLMKSGSLVVLTLRLNPIKWSLEQ